MTGPLRIGLLLDRLDAPAWVAQMVTDLATGEDARVVLAILNAPHPSPREPWRPGLYDAYRALDAVVFPAGDDPFAPLDLTDRLAACPRLTATTEPTAIGATTFTAATLAAIHGHRLDVAIKVGFDRLSGGALTIARFGVWAYRGADHRSARRSPPGALDVLEGGAPTGLILERLGDDPAGTVVLRRLYATTRWYSAGRNVANLGPRLSAGIVRAVRDLQIDGDIAAAGPDRHLEPATDPADPPPMAGHMLPMLTRLSARIGRELVDRARHRRPWCLAYAMTDADAARATAIHRAAPLGSLLPRLRYLHPPSGHLWADPFVMPAADGHHIFIEDLPDGRGRADIAVIHLRRDGSFEPPIPVIERSYHLSYPNVFRHGDDHYMIPDSGADLAVEIYRAVDYPYRWEPISRPIEGVAAADPTVVEHGGRWWLFVAIPVGRSLNFDELHLYQAPSPLGPWTPHRRNPVKSDARSARPAGQPFRTGGHLYRPGQDCARTYGHAVSINRVDRLDLDSYEETEVARLEPTFRPDLLGVHTVNFCDGLVVLDCRMRITRARAGM